MRRLYWFPIAVILSGTLSAQLWEVSLTSGDTVTGLTFTEIQDEVLLATRTGRPVYEIQTFDIEKIDELRFVRKKKVRAPWRTRLVGMAGGSVIGTGAGYMMGNIILWWLSYEELGSLKLFGPRPENMDSGEELIADIALKMVTVMGVLSGYDWKMEIVDDVTSYPLAHLSGEERRMAVREAIWPGRPSRIKGLVQKSVEMVKKRTGKE